MGAFGLIVGFFVGSTRGISQGADIAASGAVSAHRTFFVFLEILEATLNSDIADTDEVKELRFFVDLSGSGLESPLPLG